MNINQQIEGLRAIEILHQETSKFENRKANLILGRQVILNSLKTEMKK